MRGIVVIALALAGCPTTNQVSVDAGADAPPVDARACMQGQTCDCRASSVLPAGMHWVGADFRGNEVDPAHRVTLSRAVWVGTYEGSAGCYRRCVDERRCTDPEDMPGVAWPGLAEQYWRDIESADLPIMGLSPAQADAYCEWLGGRLPTGAEWEKLARGDDGREFPWLTAPPDPRFPEPPMRDTDVCAFASGAVECRRPTPSAIDGMRDGRGPYGHFHLIGNALEHVQDGFALTAREMLLTRSHRQKVERASFVPPSRLRSFGIGTTPSGQVSSAFAAPSTPSQKCSRGSARDTGACGFTSRCKRRRCKRRPLRTCHAQ